MSFRRLRYVFQRYANIDIRQVTRDIEPVDPATWTLKDHQALIARTPELAAVYNAI